MVRKIITGAIGGLFLASLAASAAFADVAAEISGNGAGSYNSIYIKHKTKCSVYQKNSTAVLTEIESQANTGSNTANGNTGSGVTVDTGNATSTVGVSVEGGDNIASNPCCCQCEGCDTHTWGPVVTVSGNGVESVNSVTVKKTKSSSLKQKNITEVAIGVLSKAKTGKNKAKNNTGGTVDVTTGNAVSTVDVSVSASSNTLINP